MKNVRIFYLKIFNFLVVNISIYLNRHVYMYVMVKIVFDFLLEKGCCTGKNLLPTVFAPTGSSTGKNFLPTVLAPTGSKFFPCWPDPFSEDRQTQIWRCCFASFFFFFFRVNPFSEGAWCTRKQTGSHKSCLSLLNGGIYSKNNQFSELLCPISITKTCLFKYI